MTRPHAERAVSSGVPVLDTMLSGGYPRNRATLVTGGPGTGKSTLAMQFLQAGLDAGETCLFVSTEQTGPELRDSFRPFEFDIGDENLRFTTVHPAPDRTVEDEEVITLQTLDRDGKDAIRAPFTGEYLRKHLGRFGPVDRVVFDSISGLAAVSDDVNVYRRTVLDLVRLFSDGFGATTLLTAEAVEGGSGPGVSPGNELQFTTHGVVRLWRETVADDLHRYLQVTKMRGVDHDRRSVEVEFTDDGLRAGPARRSQPPALKQHSHAPIGIPGLDRLTGGGPVRGSGVLLRHDGRANLGALFAAVLGRVLDEGHAVTLVPTIGLRPGRVDGLLDAHGYDVADLLADRRLYVVDLVGAWDADAETVVEAPETVSEVQGAFETARAGAAGDGMASIVNVDAVLHTYGESAARDLRYHQEGALLRPDDLLLQVQNPSVTDDQLGEFYVDAAEQVLRTWVEDDGLQYLGLEKSPCGFVGSTSLVEYVEEPPYVRVQDPPGSRENPMAE